MAGPGVARAWARAVQPVAACTFIAAPGAMITATTVGLAVPLIVIDPTLSGLIVSSVVLVCSIQPGDTAFVQYTGVKWSDGSVFDSSWDRGQPAAFPTNGVVAGFQQALEGQQVGSQVLVVIPPAAGYGAQEGSELQNETLVFVVDILGVQRTPAPAAG